MIGAIDPKFAYLLIAAPFLFLWVVFFLFSSTTRREQLHMSVVFAIVGGLIENLYLRDYWQPQSFAGLHIGPAILYPESILFGGAFAGIAAVVYQIVFRKHLARRDDSEKWSRRTVLVIAFFVVTALCLWGGINSIFATSAGALALVVVITLYERSLFIPAIVSGLLAVAIQFCLYELVIQNVTNNEESFRSIWLLYGTSLDVRLLDVPLTELIWGFSAGAAIGVFHKFTHSMYFVSRTSQADT
jgi:hypothetical protein